MGYYSGGGGILGLGLGLGIQGRWREGKGVKGWVMGWVMRVICHRVNRVCHESVKRMCQIKEWKGKVIRHFITWREGAHQPPMHPPAHCHQACPRAVSKVNRLIG